MTNVFISYSPKDSKHMLALREVVGRMGYKAWIDPNPKPNEDWRYAIDDAIRACDVMLVVITPHSASSVYVTYEWTFALALGVRVVPIVFKPAAMHPRLHTLESFDVGGFKDPAHFWDYFMRELRRIVGVVITPSSPAAPMSSKIDRSLMPPTTGYWVVIRRGQPLNRMFRLEREVVTLGRDVSNDIAIDDVGISRHHLRFVLAGAAGYIVEDLNSTNGILLNGVRVQGSAPLPAGALLQLGDNVVLSYEVVI